MLSAATKTSATRRTVRALAAVTVTGSVGGVAALTYQWQRENNKLLVPTMEAAARIARLLKTASVMALEYKMYDWGISQALSSNSDDNDCSQQQKELEAKLAQYQHELEKAQETYSTNNHPQLSLPERLEAKRQEKQAMQAAAENLAAVEEELETLWGESVSPRSKLHAKAAKQLLDLCHENKGVYIKVGQHLAQLDYVIPKEYIKTLSALFDDNPIMDYKDVREVIKEDLGAYPEELYEKFEEKPIASASLAQVHIAYLKETSDSAKNSSSKNKKKQQQPRKLAVKVQHRGLRETSAGDIFSLVTVVRAAEYLFEDFNLGWMADEIAPNLPRELDFQNEARNSEEAKRNIQKVKALKDFCVIPNVRWKYTSPRVLTMEFEEGFKATDTDKMDQAGLKKKDVAKLISSVFSSQVFLSGFVHCDPHPANVMIRPHPRHKHKPQMVLVDHGLYRKLDNDFRLNYALLWKNLMLADLNGIKQACIQLGLQDSGAYTLFAAMLTARPFDEIIERSKQGGSFQMASNADPAQKSDQAIIRGYAQRFLHEIIGLLDLVPRQMLLLLKMNDCLRHIDYNLGKPANTLIVSGQYAAQALYEQQQYNYSNKTRSADGTTTAIIAVPSWWEQFQAWWSYFKVVLRINVHETSLWVLEKTGRLQL